VPKRSTERRRRNKPEVAIETVVAGGPVEQPAASPDWSPIAVEWYESLAESGQAQYFEPSDWQAARFVAYSMTRLIESHRGFSSELFKGVWSAMNDLLTTEAARRRARIEVERARENAEPAPVESLEERRARVANGGTF